MRIATFQRLNWLIVCAGIVVGATSSGCVPGPNLLPAKAPGWEDSTDRLAYCNILEGNTGLVVVISNIGNEDAPASTTRVTFTTLPTGDLVFDISTSAIPAGDEVELDPIFFDTFPSNCFQANCWFTITADVEDDVDETSEANTVEGYCLG